MEEIEQDIVTMKIPREQYKILEDSAKDWPAYTDYKKRQNELNAEIDKQKKQRKTFTGFIELFVFVGVVCVSVLSALALLITLYFAFVGIKIDSLPLILGTSAFLLLGFNIFQFIRVFQAGEWFKFGLELRKWKNGWVGFTRGRGILLVAEPYKQKTEFRKGVESTIFLTKGKGYHDNSTGATIRTVREGAICDFDVEEEYKGDIEDIGKDVKTISQESWFAGAIWNKIDLPMLKTLLIIAIVVAAISAFMGMASLATGYQAQENLSKQISWLDGNISAKITAIQSQLTTHQNAPGVSG